MFEKRNPRFGFPLLILFSIVTLLPAAGSRGQRREEGHRRTLPAATPAPTYVADELVIRFRAGLGEDEIYQLYRDYDLSLERNLDSDLRDNDPEERLCRVPAGRVPALITALRQDPAVVYAEPNYRVSIDQVPGDTGFTQLWGLHNVGQTGGLADADIDAPEAWDLTTGSRSVIVAILDSGIDYNHEDLAANVWVNPGEIPGNGLDDDDNGYVDDVHGINVLLGTGDPMDDNGHGTHVAGTVGAAGNNGIGVTGVNWNVRIAACKFLDAQGSGTTADAAECVKYFNALKSAGENIVVANSSFGGGGFSQLLQDAMQGLDQPGMEPILHVAAAGNTNRDLDQFAVYPAAFSLANVISVAASDDTDSYPLFSNYGASSVDLAAPGVGILSTLPIGTAYGSMSGTSMAAPHVTGAAALLWSVTPAADAAAVKARLLAAADPLADSTKPTVTGGRLNVFRALQTETVPPAAVTDLTVTGADFSSVTLSWTATGDDGLTGTASRYDVRYALTPITEQNWEAATRLAGEPQPGPPGTLEGWTATGLPSGSTLSLALKVGDDAGNVSALSNVVQITTVGSTPPTITSSPPGSAVAGELYTYQAQADGTQPISWSLPAAPAGMIIDSATGLLSWTPSAGGFFNVTVRAANSAGSDDQSFTVGVVELTAPTITSAPVTTAGAGVTYAYQAAATGTQPISWALLAAPAGMSIDAASGLLSWPAPVAGGYPVQLQALNAGGTDAQSFTVTVSGAQPVDTTVTMRVIEGWDSGGGRTLTSQGDLGLVLSSDNNRLRVDRRSWVALEFEAGVPQNAAVRSVKILVEHHEQSGISAGSLVWKAGGGPLSAPVALTSVVPPLFIGPSAEKTASWDVTSWIDSAAKINDLKLVVDNGDARKRVLLDQVRVQVTFSAAPAAPQPPVINSAPPVSATVGQRYVYDAQAGGTTPINWSLPAGPAGMSIDAATGVVDWTPQAGGSFNVTVRASNAAGLDEQSYLLGVAAPLPPTIISTPVTAAVAGQPYRYQPQAGGAQPIAWSLLSAPAAMTIDATTGRLDWTPAGSGSFAVQLRASNSAGADSQAFTIVVAPRPAQQTLTLGVVEGWDQNSGQTLSSQGDLSLVRSSDNNRLRIERESFVSFEFDGSIPAGATILSVTILVEHHEESGSGANSQQWQAGGGSLAAPTVLTSTSPQLLIGPSREATIAWDVTQWINTPAQVNDLKLVLRNADRKRRTLVDRVTVEVVIAP